MAEEMASEATAPESGGWKLESLNVRKAENGGVIVSCAKRRDVKEQPNKASSYEDRYQSKDYAFTSVDDALGYIAQELGAAQGGSTGMGQSAAPGRPPR